jgi:Ubiquitin-like modifier-activating enzyme ATG7 N-terminus
VIRVPAGYYRAEGMIKNVNTIEEYRSIDKGSMLQQAGRTVSFYESLLRWNVEMLIRFSDMGRY